MDTIKLIGSWKDTSEASPHTNLLQIVVEINGKPVQWESIDVHSLYSYWMDSQHPDFPQSPFSRFEPFTCSCGIAGCAGICNGIRVKARKNTVEWRASKEDGYGFLPKTFYSFDRKQYEEARNSFFFWLQRYRYDVDVRYCTDLGYYEGGETTVEEFFEWVEDEQ